MAIFDCWVIILHEDVPQVSLCNARLPNTSFPKQSDSEFIHWRRLRLLREKVFALAGIDDFSLFYSVCEFYGSALLVEQLFA